MIEGEPRKLPKIISASLGWFRGRWNATYYGFSEGRVVRDRVDVLLGQERLDKKEFTELLDFMRKTSSAILQLRMSKKILDTTDQMIEQLQRENTSFPRTPIG